FALELITGLHGVPVEQSGHGYDDDHERRSADDQKEHRALFALRLRVHDHSLNGCLADARCTRRGGSSWWQVRASYSCGRRSAGAICGSTVAGNASGFHVLRRVGFEIEDELRSAGAELNAVAGDNPCGSDDPLFVNEGAVSAVQVGDHKLVRVGRVLRDLRVLASHKIVSFGIVFYG